MDLDLLITSMADAVVESNRREVVEAVPPGPCVEYVGELSKHVQELHAKVFGELVPDLRHLP